MNLPTSQQKTISIQDTTSMKQYLLNFSIITYKFLTKKTVKANLQIKKLISSITNLFNKIMLQKQIPSISDGVLIHNIYKKVIKLER